MRRHVLCMGFLAAVLLGWAASASATLQNFKTYKETHPGKEPKEYTCKICHEHAVGNASDLNAYGKLLQQVQPPSDSKKLTGDDFKAVESQDTDGDGVADVEELTAGTDPKDPASTPAASPTPAGSEKPSSRRPEPSQRLWAKPERAFVTSAWADDSTTPSADTPSPASSKSKTAAAKTTEAPAPKAEYVGTETCAACHAKQYQEFRHSTHSRISVPGESAYAQGCEMCHGPGSLHVEAGGGRGVGGIINPRKDPSTCFACHLDKKAEFRLPYHHPVLEGKMGCTDCHTPHAPEVRPWSATSLKDINEVCFRCHKDQRGPFVNEHEALREGCTTCHKVHGSIHEKMLLVRDANLCLRCHTQTNFPTIGGSGHSSRLNQGTCFSAGCHTAVHGSNFDEHLRY